MTEKGSKERRLPLLEAAPAILQWLEVAGLTLNDATSPLFPALAKDKRTLTNDESTSYDTSNSERGQDVREEHRAQRQSRFSPGYLYAQSSQDVCRECLRHGAHVHQVQQWLGHSDIRTTQEYITYKDDDIEDAARRCQIR